MESLSLINRHDKSRCWEVWWSTTPKHEVRKTKMLKDDIMLYKCHDSPNRKHDQVEDKVDQVWQVHVEIDMYLWQPNNDY